MKWIRLFSAAIVLCSMTATVQASVFTFGGGKSSGCGDDCQPFCCKPTVVRPCWTNVYTHQRKCSSVKPSCCNTCCAPTTCCAPAACCAPSICCAPTECGSDQGSCCPADGCGESACCVPSACGEEGCRASKDDCCTIATLIYQSMTACYAKDRKEAIHRLGDHFDCCCHPEIMNAFIYALNDSDERVRAKAADEIGDQIRRNRCCCGSPTISALTCALADCDRSVRRQAEEALLWSGYEVVDRCCTKQPCQTCTPRGNVWAGRNDGDTGTTPEPAELPAPSPAPPAAPPAPPTPVPQTAPLAPVEVLPDSVTSVYENTPPTAANDSEFLVNSGISRSPHNSTKFSTQTIRTSLTGLLSKVR